MNSMIFIHPNTVEFSTTELVQTVSIFNPYDFSISFVLKCTRPLAFSLSTSEGEILAKHSLDIVINLLDKSIVEEKFQVRIFNATKIKKLGEKVLKVTMKSESGDSGKADDGPKSQLFKVDHFQDLNQQQPVPSAYQSTIDMAHRLPNQYFNYIALVICLLLLMVPHDDTSNSAFQLIQINVNVKLVAAYILGIVSVFIIRN